MDKLIIWVMLLILPAIFASARSNPVPFINEANNENIENNSTANSQLITALQNNNRNRIAAQKQSYIASLKKNAVINYHGKQYKITQNKNNIVTACPYYMKNFYSGHDWGWFSGNDCIKIDKAVLADAKFGKQASKPKFATQAQLEKKIPWKKIDNVEWLSNISVPQFHYYFKIIKNIAVAQPTPKNMQAYVSMQDMARRKSVAFAHSMVNYILDNPQYNMQKNFGSDGWSYRRLLTYHSKTKKKYLENNNNRIGIYLLIKGSCPYCNQQEKVLNWLSADYNLTSVLVSKDYCPAESKMTCTVAPFLSKLFKIKYYPTLVMVYKKNNGKPAFQPIGSGLINEEQLSNRIYYFTKLIKAKDEGKSNPYLLVHNLQQNITFARGKTK